MTMKKEIDWNLCFIWGIQGSKKLQSSLDAQPISVRQAYNDLADRIKEFHHMSLFPVPLKMNKLKGKLELDDALTRQISQKI